MKNLLYLFIVLPSFLLAQIKQELRKEIDVEENAVDFVNLAGESGIVSYGYRIERPDKFLAISLFDNQFNGGSPKEIAVPLKSYFSSVIYDDKEDNLYFLYADKKNLTLVTYDVKRQALSKKEIPFAESFYCWESYRVGSKIFITGTQKGIPAVLVVNISDGTQKYVVVPGENKKRAINSCQPDSRDEALAIFYRDGKDMKKSGMYVFLVGQNGEIVVRPLLLDKDPKYTIINGKITWIKDREFILAGSYSVDGRVSASGVFFSKWVDEEQEFITYHSFTDFENFFKFLPEKKQQKIEQKREKKKEAGKEDFIKSFVVNHPVLIREDGYTYIGEFYYPTYRTEYYTTYVKGTPVTHTRQVFDGYQYTHAAILGLTKEGKKEYDYCFDINLNFKPLKVIKNIRISDDGTDVMKLLYCTGKNIKAVHVTNGVISEKNYGEIETEKEGDVIKWTGQTNSVYWYDNYFLVFGRQKIKNKENEDGKKKRTVFFLSKISFGD